MHKILQLARCLSDAAWHTETVIASELGCRRADVQEHIVALRDLGLEIETANRKGHRLTESLELLDRDLILEQLGQMTRAHTVDLNIAATLNSTNRTLQDLPLAQQHMSVIAAEHQSGGRGRRGRQWHSPFGRNLYLSLGWRFAKPLAALGCLPLVVALSAAGAMTRAGLTGHKIKWPNDLLIDDHKLCGCLVEVQGETHGPCHAVIGVGINVHMPATQALSAIDQPWTDLHNHLSGYSRNRLAVLLLQELITDLEVFSDQGFAPFKQSWHQMDALRDRDVTVTTANKTLRGIASGIDEKGSLLLDTGCGFLSLRSGEVSVRPITSGR